MAQQVKDPALSLQGLELLLWYSFDPWPRNFHMLGAWPKKKKKKKKEKDKQTKRKQSKFTFKWTKQGLGPGTKLMSMELLLLQL